MLTIQKRFSALQTATMSIGVLGIGFVGSLATLNFYHPGKNTNSSTTPTLSSIAPSAKTNAIPIVSSGSGSNSNTGQGSTNSQVSQPRTAWPQSTYQQRPAQAVQPAANPSPTTATPVITPVTPSPSTAPTPASGTTQPAPATPPAAPTPQPISTSTSLPLTSPLVAPTVPAIPLVN
jgi:hypothetical protein